MNVIITNLSTIHSDSKECSYTSDKGSFSGTNTNDAPVKYLLTCLKEQNAEEKIRIIAITTPEAESAFEAICKTIRDFTDEKQMQIDEDEIKKVSNIEFSRSIREIISLVNSGDKVYLDTTGGMRNAVYFLMTLVRILEYSKVSLEKAIYSNFTKHEIEDITPDYQRLNLINAAELFTSLGNSDGLQNFFEGKKSSEIKNVIKVMNEFSEAVALCRTSELDKILEKLNNSLTELDGMTPTTENEILFQSISGVIREKFGIHEEGHKTIDYVDIIRWCLDNKQIQQAVTIYTEKIPSYFRQKKYYSADFSKDENAGKDFEKKLKKSSFDDDYVLLNEGFLHIVPASSSQYPVGRYLQSRKNDKHFRKVLEKASNVPEFAEHLEISAERLEKPVKAGLKRYFQLTKKLFDENGVPNSTASIRTALAKEPVLLNLVFNSDCKTPEKLVKALFDIQNSEKWYEALQGYTSEEKKESVVQNPALNLVEHLSEVHDCQKVYQIHVSIPKMQLILKDYLYIKNFLRHAINHASDENERSESERNYFRSKGYPVNQNMPFSDVKSLLYRALKNLDLS